MKEIIKRDKEENWQKAINFIPKENEIIVYDCGDNIKIKVGNGINKVNDLPFENEYDCYVEDGCLNIN